MQGWGPEQVGTPIVSTPSCSVASSLMVPIKPSSEQVPVLQVTLNPILLLCAGPVWKSIRRLETHRKPFALACCIHYDHTAMCCCLLAHVPIQAHGAEGPVAVVTISALEVAGASRAGCVPQATPKIGKQGHCRIQQGYLLNKAGIMMKGAETVEEGVLFSSEQTRHPVDVVLREHNF